MRAPGAAESPLITSSTSTSNCEIAVPRITVSPLHFIPERTSESRMIGSAARAVAAGTIEGGEARERESVPHRREATRPSVHFAGAVPRP